MSVKRVSDGTRLRSTNTNALLQATTTTATNAHGGAFNTPWGGSVTIRRSVPHEIEMALNFVAGSAAVDCSYHFLLNGVCRLEGTIKGGMAVSNGREIFRKALHDLTPGTYTWAVQGAVASAATAYIGSSANSPSFVSIKEAVQ